jgi:hypothetical protein
LRTLQTWKKEERINRESREKADAKKSHKKFYFKKAQSRLDRIRGEIYGEGDRKIASTNYSRLNDEYHDIGVKPSFNNTFVRTNGCKGIGDRDDNNLVHDLEEDPEKEQELNNLLATVSGFDFDKYVKDSELKEALYLIKSKFDKDVQQENIDDQINELLLDQQQNIQHDCELPDEGCGDHEIVHFSKTKLDPIEDKEKHLRELELKKMHVAEKILKSDNVYKYFNFKNFKQVHSVQSIKKMLERQGFTDIKRISNIVFSQIDDLKIVKDNEYQVYNNITARLPFLRSIPLA